MNHQQRMEKEVGLPEGLEIFPFVGVDIGGTLGKVCLSVRQPCCQLEEYHPLKHLSISMHGLYTILFFQFLTTDMMTLVSLLKLVGESGQVQQLYLTGGGAHKYSSLMKEQLAPLEVIKVDEFESLSLGMDFLRHNTSAFSFRYLHPHKQDILHDSLQYPFLLVNIGSGVSMLKFTSRNNYTRIGGTPLGGGTFLGLCGLMTGQTDFDKLLQMSQEGDSSKVDLQVKDMSMTVPGLNEDSLAISLSRMGESTQPEDVVKSLLQMIAYNIAQIAYLQGCVENVHTVYFAGNFIRSHHQTMETITFAFQHFNQQQPHMQPIFLKHDGYIGALGCFSQSLFYYQQLTRRNSI